MSSRLIGDWKKAGITLERLATALFPMAKVRLYEDGEMVLQKLQGHIDSQDLSWANLSPSTIKQKGHNKIYVETGGLRDNLEVRTISNTQNGTKIFIGVSNRQTHSESGLKYTDLMIFLEYGTTRIPARPLIRPTWEEVEPLVKEHFADILEKIVRG